MEGDDKYDFIHNFTDGIGCIGGRCTYIHGRDWWCDIAAARRSDRMRDDHRIDRKAFQEKEEVSPVTGTPSLYFKINSRKKHGVL